MAAVLIVIALLQLLQLTLAQSVDRTLEAETSGASVVRAVVDKIDAVFGEDNQFLRRVAFVESKDGTDSGTYRNGYYGGIWQVDEIGFRDTQNVASHPRQIARYEQIMQEFGINWPDVVWMDLRRPLYSGIAARLVLLNIPEPIPCDITGQAVYWKRYYNTELGRGTVQKFIDDVRTLGGSCKVNSDVVFILDGSGSIGSNNFELVKDFVLQYLNNFDIGPTDNQIGVITFSSSAIVEFALNTYGDKTSLNQAIRNIRYTGGGTNIPAALCQLIQTYSSNSSGARLDGQVFRVAILMTDGQSQDDINVCNFRSVAEAANAVHAASPPIVVLALGVGSEYSPQDVVNIASRPEYVSSAQSFSTSQLECVQAIQENDICNKITTPVPLKAVNRASLDQGEQVRWQLDVPESGTVLYLDVEQGSVVMYASTKTTSPNEAFYEWKTQTSSSASVVVRPMAQNKERGKRNIETISRNQTTIPVYVAINGLDSSSTFTLSGAKKRETGEVLLLVAVLMATIVMFF